MFQVERIEFQNQDGSFVLADDSKKHKKTFRQRRPDPKHPGQWIYRVNDVRSVPYRLPELLEALGNGSLVVIAEGERKVDLLHDWNIPSTCNAGGAKNWRAEHSAYLRGAEVVILPDYERSRLSAPSCIPEKSSRPNRSTAMRDIAP